MKIKNEIHDISVTISSESLVYPGDDPLVVESLCSINDSCPCNIQKLVLSTHFLTHVDPPLHFIEGGKSLTDIPLSRFIGEALVVEVEGDFISESHIPESIENLNILFKTRNSFSWKKTNQFIKNHVYINHSAAKKLVKGKANLVGIDYISVDKYGDEDYPAHRELLGNDVLVLEGVNLEKIVAGKYKLTCLPLKIEKADGSPVRAVLEEINN